MVVARCDPDRTKAGGAATLIAIRLQPELPILGEHNAVPEQATRDVHGEDHPPGACPGVPRALQHEQERLDVEEEYRSLTRPGEIAVIDTVTALDETQRHEERDDGQDPREPQPGVERAGPPRARRNHQRE